jgi:hypothetical protein
MSPESLSPKKEELQLLAELGMVAAGRGLRQESEAIATALAAMRPEQALAGIIRAMAAMSRGDDEAAVRHLRDQALVAEPGSLEAKALLGMAQERAGYRHAARGTLASIARPGAEGAPALAQALLDASVPGGRS